MRRPSSPACSCEQESDECERESEYEREGEWEADRDPDGKLGRETGLLEPGPPVLLSVEVAVGPSCDLVGDRCCIDCTDGTDRDEHLVGDLITTGDWDRNGVLDSDSDNENSEPRSEPQGVPYPSSAPST